MALTGNLQAEPDYMQISKKELHINKVFYMQKPY